MDITTPVAKSLKSAIDIFRKDLEALPDDAFCRSFGPATRTVADIVYEVNMVNDHVAMILRGDTPFDWPDDGWVKAPAEFNAKEIVIKAFTKSSQEILELVAPLSAEELDAPFEAGGSTTSRAERCRFITLHLWYHSGQLNFIQTLLGDAEMHW